MVNLVQGEIKLLVPGEADFLEAARYLGYAKVQPPEEEVLSLIKECSNQMLEVLTPRAVYEIFELKNDGTEISFADVKIKSKNLCVNLKDCSRVAIFASTIGPKPDALIRKYQMMDTVKAAVFQAVGAMYIEKFVEYVNGLIKEEAKKLGKDTKPRYSPGYGDVGLEVQKDFFRLLPCTKIGLTLMDTLIMSPEKSVTAFVGIKD